MLKSGADVCSGSKTEIGRLAICVAEEPARPLQVCAFGKRECIFDINPEIPNGAFDLRVTKQNLHCAQVARLFVDDRGFGSAQ